MRFALLLAALLTARAAAASAMADWLVSAAPARAAVHKTQIEVEMSNGLIRRVWRLSPNAATVAFDNLMTGQAVLRGVKPEAIVELDGHKYAVGGLLGQPDYAYLRREWLDHMTADPAAFRFTGFETGQTKARLEWNRVRYADAQPWPPPGASLALRFEPPPDGPRGLAVTVH